MSNLTALLRTDGEDLHNANSAAPPSSNPVTSGGHHDGGAQYRTDQWRQYQLVAMVPNRRLAEPNRALINPRDLALFLEEELCGEDGAFSSCRRAPTTDFPQLICGGG